MLHIVTMRTIWFYSLLVQYLREKKRVLWDQNFQYQNSYFKQVPALKQPFQCDGRVSWITLTCSKSQTRGTYFWGNPLFKNGQNDHYKASLDAFRCSLLDPLVSLTDKGELRKSGIKERLIFSALFETDAETVWKVKVVTIWLSEARSTPVDAVALAAGS